jgi:hypothetical protein
VQAEIYIFKYYSTFKREILPFATACMKVEDIILSEISQAQKEKNRMIDLYVESKKKEMSDIQR